MITPRSHRHRKPSFNRLLKAKAMTIALGMVFPDGIVISADSQETWGDEKTHVNKISSLSRPNCKCIVAGAGSGWLVDYARSRIFKMVLGLKDTDSYEEQLQLLMNSLYALEFANYPDSETEKQISLLVAIKVGSNPLALYSVYSSLVTKVNDFGIIGTEPLTDDVKRVHALNLDLDRGRWAGAYLAWQAKSRFSAVGGKLYSYSISNAGKIEVENSLLLLHQEELFERISNLEPLLMALAHHSTKPTDVKFYLKWINFVITETQKESLKMDGMKKAAKKKVDKFKSSFTR